jgi:hypothetical protein
MADQRSSELAATDTAERDSGGNARTSDQPMPRVPSTAGGCVAPSRRHVDGRGRTACRHEPAGAADHPGAHNPSPAT